MNIVCKYILQLKNQKLKYLIFDKIDKLNSHIIIKAIKFVGENFLK